MNITSDNVLESNETFQLSIISSTLHNHVTAHHPSKVTVTIIDDDGELLGQ